MKKISLFRILAFCALTACGQGRSALAPPPATPELWLWMHSDVNNDGGLEASSQMIDRARAVGYTGIAFWDAGFTYLTPSEFPDDRYGLLKRAMEYATRKGMKVLAQGTPFGYSNFALTANPNWAEGLRVSGARFEVDASGRKLNLVNSFSGVTNPGFESGMEGWATGDRGVSVDSAMVRGGMNAGLIHDAPANGRFAQLLKVTPWRQYHVRLFVKTQGYSGGPPTMVAFDEGSQKKVRLYKQTQMPATMGWTQVDAAFNSQSSSSMWLYFGEWGGCTGTLLFDDVTVEETALVYLIRRAGAALKVYDPASGAVFQENRELEAVSDLHLKADPEDDYHAPPEVTLRRGTKFKPGQVVAMDFYAAQPVDSRRLGLCLTDPGVQKRLAEVGKQVMKTVPAGGGVFLQYDEMRQLNSCGSCRAKNMTPGQLLAWHAGQTMQMYRSLRPGVSFYAWNDMFDPFANAHEDYYLVEGDLAESWLGLPTDVTIMNWNMDHLKDSLHWFSGQDGKQPIAHRQIIAGYYDTHNGAAAATSELQQAHGIPGIDGLMYTTWTLDYTQMQAFADAARQYWNAYRTSVSQP